MTTRTSLVVLSLLLAPPAAAAEPAWTSLFDGKTLNGWVKRGGEATYEVKDGAIVGSTAPNTKNTFLCTERRYSDFVLELEFKVDPELNSGIQIRGQSYAAYQDGRVHGYQVEIDPDVKRGRNWTGGLYDEGRRGWLVDLKDNEPARKAFKPEVWNKVRVEAMGESLKTWLNGVPAADLVDSMDLEGFIALQVHQVGKRTDPLHVSWRNIRLQDLGRHAWLPLFDGKSLKGLKAAGDGNWTIEGGALVGRLPRSARHAALLAFDKPLADLTARVEYRLTAGNGGLYFRSPGGEKGTQVDLTPAGAKGIYEAGGRKWLAQSTAKPAANAKAPPADAWRIATVSAHGGHVIAYDDGKRIAELKDDPPPKDGQIAIELAAMGVDSRLEVRKLEILSPPLLPPVAGVPVGWCIRVQGTAPEDAVAAGFEYIELALQDIISLTDEEFEKTAARLKGLGIPALGGYNLIPNEMKIVGPDADPAKQDEHLHKVFPRLQTLGLKMVVFGSGPSRKVPEGFAREKAMQQLVDFGRRAAKEAKKHGLTFLLQPLRPEDTNLINTVPEALAAIKAVNHPSFQLLVDYSFMAIQKEEPAVLLKAGPHLRHVWVSNPNGRTYAMGAEEADYAAFFAALKQIHYKGAVSVHARTDSFFADAPRGIAFLRQMGTSLSASTSGAKRR
jgi:sugar phosphate isomerase/epimerase